ncbi:cytochrome C oxidase subunit IV family protein [[Mycobacterium] burgundiense]|uniref:Cytochrome C oxidase subunit IV family protein n=1 Tax=[Mycobacterium] burgundiense TaxID=3064286 RepID=A0ABM9LFP9_9MYCO|nr:cytochrome C oxidase subunit IV family protein [Mycolicibacterium sp. MU0053]CAJ1498205.1 cytochrome C oxidase subunit IV family protein [Mycolicibacterium sp. MU0053]
MTTTSGTSAGAAAGAAAPATTARTINLAWIALCLITIGSWWLAPAHFKNTVDPSVPITALVLLLTFIKSRLVMRYFMEVRTAPQWLRRSCDAWLVLLHLSVFVIYLF